MVQVHYKSTRAFSFENNENSLSVRPRRKIKDDVKNYLHKLVQKMRNERGWTADFSNDGDASSTESSF
jgi:hypothetical protein